MNYTCWDSGGTGEWYDVYVLEYRYQVVGEGGGEGQHKKTQEGIIFRTYR